MSIRLPPALLLPAVLGAAVAAYLMTDRASSSAAPPPADLAAAATATAANATAGTPLPPNHPAVPGLTGQGPHGGGTSMPNGDNQQPPAITWTAPAGWQTQQNSSPMRLATYKVGDGSELYVARVGGSVDANVQRWTSQFDSSPKADQTQKQVRGLKVTVVRIAGTFLGGGMNAAAPEKHDGWAMLAAIVESTGAPYFFKMVGPADQVDHARASFDSLVDSVTPRTTQ